MVRSKKIIVVVSLLVLQAIAVYSYLSLAPPHAGQMDREGVIQKKVNLHVAKSASRDGGLPIQRKRIDDFIEAVSTFDFAQCCTALHAPTSRDGTDLIEYAGIGSGFGPSSLRFVQVLADRRVAKLYAYLKSMTPQAASQAASSLFDEKLTMHAAHWRRTTAWVRELPETSAQVGSVSVVDAKNPDLTGASYRSGGPLESTRANIHALSASLFLTTAYCEPQVVLEKIDAWNSILGSQVTEIRSNPRLAPLIIEAKRLALPEKLFLLNLYVMILERHDYLRADELANEAGVYLPPFGRAVFSAWDAGTNTSDFTHKHAGVPADASKTLTTFNVARDWVGSDMSHEERQEAILAAVRGIVEKHAGGN